MLRDRARRRRWHTPAAPTARRLSSAALKPAHLSSGLILERYARRPVRGGELQAWDCDDCLGLRTPVPLRPREPVPEPVKAWAREGTSVWIVLVGLHE
jgi:hypothetical protein